MTLTFYLNYFEEKRTGWKRLHQSSSDSYSNIRNQSVFTGFDSLRTIGSWNGNIHKLIFIGYQFKTYRDNCVVRHLSHGTNSELSLRHYRN